MSDDALDMVVEGVARFAALVSELPAPGEEVVGRTGLKGPSIDHHPELTAADQQSTVQLQGYVRHVQQGLDVIGAFVRDRMSDYLAADEQARAIILAELDPKG